MAYTSLAFGKHKGVPIDQVPTDYLEWFLLNMDNIRPDTRTMINGSLARRGGAVPKVAKVAGAGNGNESSVGIPCPACGAMLHVILAEATDQDDEVPF